MTAVNPVLQLHYADGSRAAVDAALNPGEAGLNEGTEKEVIVRNKIALSGSVHLLSEERCQANPSGVQTLMGGPFAPYELPYSEGSANLTFNGISGAAPIACPWIKKGKMVTILLPAVSGTYAEYSSYAGCIVISGIPAPLLPVTDQKMINVPAVILTYSAVASMCAGYIQYDKTTGFFFMKPFITNNPITQAFAGTIGLPNPQSIQYDLY